MSTEHAYEVVSSSVKMKRILWIDCCRVLAMFSIVYGHSIIIMPPDRRLWDAFVMGPFWDASAPPVTVLMYFFLSGCLQHTHAKYLDFRKFFFLAIPLVVWNLMQVLLVSAIGSQYGIADRGLIPWLPNANGPLWFLELLAWLSLFIPIILKIPAISRLLASCTGLIAVIVLHNILGHSLWEPMCLRITEISVFVLGTSLNGQGLAKFSRFIYHAGPWILLFEGYMFFKAFYAEYALNITGTLYSIVGIAVVLSYGAVLARFCPKVCRWIAQWAPAVFFIYAAHWPLFTLWRKIEESFGFSRLSGQMNILYTIICLIVCCLIWKHAIKSLPAKLLEWIFLTKKPRTKETT